MLEFVLGGARSGKSHYAQEQALASELHVVYIATATAGDAEMRARIDLHRQSRPAHWTLCEEPLELAALLRRYAQPEHFVIVDCLTLWLSNLLAESPAYYQQQLQAFFDCLPDLDASVIFVSNEVGMGITPMGQLSRRFVDESGRLHQRLAQQCHRVTQMIVGIPHVIKNECR
jgi:adenosylcobinamide kinase / adenosylcobinamide-phosphate guanylyltransferase